MVLAYRGVLGVRLLGFCYSSIFSELHFVPQVLKVLLHGREKFLFAHTGALCRHADLTNVIFIR